MEASVFICFYTDFRANTGRVSHCDGDYRAHKVFLRFQDFALTVSAVLRCFHGKEDGMARVAHRDKGLLRTVLKGHHKHTAEIDAQAGDAAGHKPGIRVENADGERREEHNKQGG